MDAPAHCYTCGGKHWWKRAGAATEWFCYRCATPIKGIGPIDEIRPRPGFDVGKLEL